MSCNILYIGGLSCCLKRKQRKGCQIDINRPKSSRATIQCCCHESQGKCHTWHHISLELPHIHVSIIQLSSELRKDIICFLSIVPFLAISKVEGFVYGEELTVASTSPLSVSIEQLIVWDVSFGGR